MAGKATKAKAAGTEPAPAADQVGDVSTSSAGAQEAGTAPAAGADNQSTQQSGATGGESGGEGGDPAGAGDDAAGAGEGGAGNESTGSNGGDAGEGAGAGDGTDPGTGTDAGKPDETTVSGESVNAPTQEGANAQTSESANDQDNLEPEELEQSSGADGLETAQTPSENGPDSPVILGAWSLPAIDKFPATLTLTNHTPCRFVVLGKGIPVDGSIQLEVTRQLFIKLAKSLRGPAQLDKWDNVRGLQVAYDPQN